MSSSFDGAILDATAVIDFRWIGQWGWLKRHYGPLFVAQEVLDSDRLGRPERRAAARHLDPLLLDTEEMLASFAELRRKAPLLSAADRSTLSLAQHRHLLCISDDAAMVDICGVYGIPFIRMLRLLSEMTVTGHRRVDEVIAMADTLVNSRGKRIAPDILDGWKRSLEG